MMRGLTFFSLLCLLVLTACPKEEPPQLVDVLFVFPVTIKPVQESIARGDTLWLEASYSDSMLEVHSGRRFRLSPQDIDPRLAVGFFELPGKGVRPKSFASTFTIVNKVGGIYDVQQTFGTLKPVYANNRFSFKVGVIPTRQGIVQLSLLASFSKTPFKDNPILPFIQLPPDSNGNAQVAILKGIFPVINEGKTNFHLYKQYGDPTSEANNSEADKYYNEKSSFVIEVK